MLLLSVTSVASFRFGMAIFYPSAAERWRTWRLFRRSSLRCRTILLSVSLCLCVCMPGALVRPQDFIQFRQLFRYFSFCISNSRDAALRMMFRRAKSSATKHRTPSTCECDAMDASSPCLYVSVVCCPIIIICERQSIFTDQTDVVLFWIYSHIICLLCPLYV